MTTTATDGGFYHGGENKTTQKASKTGVEGRYNKL